MLKQYIVCALMSMVPVFELRAALPAGIAMGLSPLPLLAACAIGNIIPAPFIILFIRKIMDWAHVRGGFLDSVFTWIEEHGRKRLDTYYKYKVLGLFILVAVPLPGTGAWTGALVASLLDVRLKNALPTICLGVLTAGVIMLLLSLGVSALIA